MTGGALDVFEAERPSLIALAYRMLGEKAAAEDIVQETWLRWSAQDTDGIKSAAAWLRRTAANIAIDVLRSAKARREVYPGPWLPEPLLADTADNQEDIFAKARECQLALLWAMERLSAEERAAFVLRKAFDADYADIAGVLGKSEAACRQLVSRASKRVQEVAPRFTPSAAEKAAVLANFARAVAARDHAAVLSLLAPDVVAVSDGGGKALAARNELHGADRVSRFLVGIASKAQRGGGVRKITVNGDPALAILEGGTRDLIGTVAVNENGLITWIYILRNPDKFPH